MSKAVPVKITANILDVFPEASLLLSHDGMIVKANASFLKLAKLEAEEIEGMRIYSLCATNHAQISDFLNLCSQNRNFVPGAIELDINGEVLAMRAEGAAVAISAESEVNEKQNGIIILRLRTKENAVEKFNILNEKIQSLTEEIIQRNQIEYALRQSETLFRELANAIPQIVWAADSNGTITYYNRQWYENTGSEIKQEITADDWLATLHPDDRDRVSNHWYECVKSGTPYECEYRILLASDNDYHWHLGRGVPVRDETGSITRWLGTTTDIDEQKLAAKTLEDAVNEKTSHLQALVGQLEEFSYSVSHDLRTPVRIVQGYTEILLNDHYEEFSEETRSYLRRITDAGKRMDLLIKDLLSLSRVSRSDVHLATVDLQQLVKSIIQQYPQLQFPFADILAMDLPKVRGQEHFLTQTMTNLLTNAVKFVSPGTTPRIRIYSENLGKHTRIWVEDNGIGIDPEHHNRIFGLFERIHPEEKFEGTGVGLAIVKKSIERMGGAAGVVSDGANGSKFWIELGCAF